MSAAKRVAKRPAKKRAAKRATKTVGKPFLAGFDPRRNLNGRPRDHDALRDLIRDIGAQAIPNAGGLTYLEGLVLTMLTSKDGRDHQNILEHAFGKVAQPLTFGHMSDEDLRRFIAERVGVARGGAGGSGEAEAAVATADATAAG